MKEEMKKYLDGLKFGLKDKEKTEDKYKNYKTEEFKSFLKNNKDFNELLVVV